MRDKHQNADNLSKKTEFYERLEQKQANQAEIMEGFSFLDKETNEALPLTRWLDADAGWIVRERSDQRRPRVGSSHGITDSQ